MKNRILLFIFSVFFVSFLYAEGVQADYESIGLWIKKNRPEKLSPYSSEKQRKDYLKTKIAFKIKLKKKLKKFIYKYPISIQSLEIRRYLAILLLREKNYKETMSLYREMLNLFPEMNKYKLECYEKIIYCLLLQGKNISAEREIKKALILFPSDRKITKLKQWLEVRKNLVKNAQIPETLLQTVTGNQISLTDLKGKVVLIDFWATWCGPCRFQMPYLKKIYTKYSGYPLVFISISQDYSKKKLLEYVKKNGLNWTHVYDNESGNICNMWGIKSIPRLFVIDKSNKIYSIDPDIFTLEKEIKKLLN